MPTTLLELIEEEIKRFDNQFSKEEWGFVDKAPCLFTDETKQYINRFFLHRHEEIKSFLSTFAHRIVEEMRKNIEEMKKESLERHSHDLKGNCDFERVNMCNVLLQRFEKFEGEEVKVKVL